VMIHFAKEKQNNRPVEYWSAKQVISIKETQAVLLSKYDRNYLIDQDLADNKTWKINWFSRHTDLLFLKNLLHNGKLLDVIDRDKTGRGYQTYTNKYSGSNLGCKKSLVRILDKYSPIIFSNIPDSVYNLGPVDAYVGQKILVNEGISERKSNKGIILSRYENDKFSFFRSIYGLKLKTNDEKQYLCILGILWSSLTRYYFFNTTANWGLWNHKILLDELLQLPIPRILTGNNAKQVISIVNKLRDYKPLEQNMLNPNGIPQDEIEAQRRVWEAELDEAVYDLYGFTEEQRDLIRDCCEVTLPFFYQPYESVGAMPAIEAGNTKWIQNYADIFAERWQPYLNDNEIMRADVHVGASDNMLAFEFYPADKTDKWDLSPKNNSWNHVLEEIGKALPKPIGTSQIILDGVVHAISKDSIIIIKRNKKRFWTRSLAREDAMSTLTNRMIDTMPEKSGNN